MESELPVTLKIFYCYAHKDKVLRDELEKHLEPLRRSGQITTWFDREIQSGMVWEREIDKHLASSDIILLLISPNFMRSDYCYGVEMEHALERHIVGEARVIPVILRPVDWQKTPLKALQALPTDGKPITTWRNRDSAFQDVARGVSEVIRVFLSLKDEDAWSAQAAYYVLDPQRIYDRATSETPVLSDPLDSQSAYGWSEGSWSDRSFLFSENAYHVNIQDHRKFVIGFARASNWSNFAFQVEMTLVTGDGGGLVFHAGSSNPYGYRFFIGQNGSDCVYGNKTIWEDKEIQININQTCLLSVVVFGNRLLLYRGKQCIADLKNNFARFGRVGLMAVDFTNHTHLIFRNAQFWNLSHVDNAEPFYGQHTIVFHP